MEKYYDNFKNFVLWIAVGLFIIASVIFIYPHAATFLQESEEETTTLKGSYGVAAQTLIGVAPTSTIINEFNTEFLATTTPTSTDYFVLGQEIDKVDLYISARSTSTGTVIAWDIAVNSKSGRATSTLNFYSYHAGSSSGGLITWVSASTTNKWALPAAGQYEGVFPLCNNNYDGTDDVPVCNAGTYRLNVSAEELSQVEVYAEVSAKSFSR